MQYAQGISTELYSHYRLLARFKSKRCNTFTFRFLHAGQRGFPPLPNLLFPLTGLTVVRLLESISSSIKRKLPSWSSLDHHIDRSMTLASGRNGGESITISNGLGYALQQLWFWPFDFVVVLVDDSLAAFK